MRHPFSKMLISGAVLMGVGFFFQGHPLPGITQPMHFQEELEESKLGKNLELKPLPKPPQPVTIVAFGDMMLDRYVWTLMQRNGLDYPFVHVPELIESLLRDEGEVSSTSEEGGGDASQAQSTSQVQVSTAQPDFLFANLEGPISDSKYVNPGTAMIFNFKPMVTEMLNKYGFNLLSLANNHAYDMGETGATQTRQYLTQAGIHHFGDARAIRAESVWTTTLKDKGVTLSFIGFNDTVSDHLDYTAATELIHSLEEKSDFTIVSIHWGAEYRTQPTATQVEHAQQFVQAGADAILGHHPHVIMSKDGSPVEWFEGPDGKRPIYYSLGNFIFDQYFQQNVQEGLGVILELKKGESHNEVIAREKVFDILKSQPQVRKP